MTLTPKYVAPGTGKAISPIGGDHTTYKAIGAETAGNFAMLEQVVPPGHGPRKHVHRREEESFYILQGEFTFEVGDETIVASAGSFVLGPRNVPHRFWNSGSSPGKFLLIISPAGLEPFFEAFSQLIAAAPDDHVRQSELAGTYGLEFV